LKEINMKFRKPRWLHSLHELVSYWIGGGIVKYRVKGCRVEMKGGGTGPFWWFAHFSDFDSPKQAEIFAKRWAKTEGGIFVS
jgi:hypothetical protein